MKKNKKKIDVLALVKECENDPEIMKGSVKNDEYEEEEGGMCWGCLEETDGSNSCGQQCL